MKIFNGMLEGIEDERTGYFVTIEVTAPSKKKAAEVAIAEATKQELRGFKIEEIEFKELDKNFSQQKVLKTFGKSYFPLTE